MVFPAYSTNHDAFHALCTRAWVCAFALVAATLRADQPPAASQAPASPEQGTPVAAENVDRDAPDFVTASLLVMGPGDELYSCAGHAALRMECPTYGLDYCFSYESESVKDKVLTFFRGKLKMGMFAVPTEEYLKMYRETGRGVMQYTLDLPPKVETRLWQLLDEKVAEGAELPYDHLKRGCAQSILAIILEALKPYQMSVASWPDKYFKSRREICHDELASHPWNRFLLHAICGAELDRNVPNTQKVLLPDDLLALLRDAKVNGHAVIDGEGDGLLTAKPVKAPSVFTPIGVSMLFFTVAAANIFLRWSWLDVGFLVFQSLAGLFFAYLVFFSNLPATSWNCLIVPFNPLPAVFWKWRRRWALGFAVVLAAWVAFMSFAPHRMTDPAYLVLVAAYILLYARIAHERCSTPSSL